MKKFILTFAFLGLSITARADETTATVYHLMPQGQGVKVGTISFTDTKSGLFIQEDLFDLPAGPHGIHVHENGNCANTVVNGKTVLGGAAGGHYDPQKTGKHAGPNNDGHKGDFPELVVSSNGTATTSFYLKDLTVADFKGRSIIIHADGDNYKDTPKPLGGGGDRIACGVIR